MKQLEAYLDRIEILLRNISPEAMRQLNRNIGTQMRQRVKERIKRNQSPNGQAFTPRQGTPSRPLRKGERVLANQPFLYHGQLRQLKNIKTAQSAAHPSRHNTQPYDDGYLWGFETSSGRVQKFNIRHIGLPAKQHQLMFRKIHQFKFLKLKADSHRITIGFLGGLIGHIAAAHQYGQDNRPERQLLGFSEADLSHIEAAVLRHIQAG